MAVKAPDVKFVLEAQGALRAPKTQAPRGKNAVSSVSQAGLEFTQVLFKK